MKINFSQKYKPFSHKPGSVCVIPLTDWKVQVFPCKLIFENLVTKEKKEFFLKNIQGPVKEFTVLLDIDKEEVVVFGFSFQGYFRYKIFAAESLLSVEVEKAAFGSIVFYDLALNSLKELKKREKLKIAFSQILPSKKREKLSFGVYKLQDFDLMKRRNDLRELLPIWFLLGQVVPSPDIIFPLKGMLLLLHECEEVIQKREKLQIESSFQSLFLAGFSEIFSPRIQDDEFQGIIELSLSEPHISAHVLLTEGYRLIRSLFLKEEKDSVSFLPCLPMQLPFGKMKDLYLKNGDTLHFEWSKGYLRSVIWHSASEREVFLNLQSPLISFRLRQSLRDKGKVLKKGEKLLLESHKTIFLDHFQK